MMDNSLARRDDITQQYILLNAACRSGLFRNEAEVGIDAAIARILDGDDMGISRSGMLTFILTSIIGHACEDSIRYIIETYQPLINQDVVDAACLSMNESAFKVLCEMYPHGIFRGGFTCPDNSRNLLAIQCAIIQTGADPWSFMDALDESAYSIWYRGSMTRHRAFVDDRLLMMNGYYSEKIATLYPDFGRRMSKVGYVRLLWAATKHKRLREVVKRVAVARRTWRWPGDVFIIAE